MTLKEKMIKARASLGMTQKQFAERLDLSARTIMSYEQGEKKPSKTNYVRIAQKLGVSVKYLQDDNCINPDEELNVVNPTAEIEERERLDDNAKMHEIMNQCTAFFAGGHYTQEQKEQVFNAVMKAYVACLEESKRRSNQEDN